MVRKIVITLALVLLACVSAVPVEAQGYGVFPPASGGSGGTTTYSTQTITASPMTITNVTHGQGARAFPECFTGAGPWTGSSCSYTVASNGDLVITYTVAPTRIDVFGATGGFANPMTTAGDIILGGAAGVATRSTLLGAGIVAGAGSLTTTGAVPYVTSSGVLGQNANFCFDNTNTRLGIGTCTPAGLLSVQNSSMRTDVYFGAPAANAAALNFQSAGATKYTIYRPASTNDLSFDSNLFSNVLYLTSNGNVGVGTANPSQLLSVGNASQFTVNSTGQLNFTSSQWTNTAAQPTCAAGTRGTVWYVAGGAGVKDTFAICAQDAGSVFAWRTIY